MAVGVVACPCLLDFQDLADFEELAKATKKTTKPWEVNKSYKTLKCRDVKPGGDKTTLKTPQALQTF